MPDLIGMPQIRHAAEGGPGPVSWPVTGSKGVKWMNKDNLSNPAAGIWPTWTVLL
ncbi:hypothetical protein JCM14036_12290 [Desulfotomaculum defluvii]